MDKRIVLVALAFSSVFVVEACKKRLPHGGEDPLYPLRGLHAAVPCEGCHGPGTPSSLPITCIECHVDDRPAPDHHPGQDCAQCHTEAGWDVGVTPTETGTLPPTGETGLTTEPTDIHASLPADQLCWDCHEVDRKDATHYADPDPLLTWDCGPCHATTGWLDDLVLHPARTPHGTYSGGQAQPEGSWVVACATCHPSSLDQFDCSTCHASIFPHYGDAQKPGPAADASCLICHENGDL